MTARIHQNLSWLAILAVLSLSLLGCMGGKGKGGRGGQGNGKGGEAEKTAVPVETVTIEAGSVADTVMATATLTSQHEVTVMARTPGQLVDLTVDEGDVVEAGQTIGRVSNPDLRLSVDVAGNQKRRAEAEVKRLKPLLDKGFIPRAEYDRAVTEMEIAADEVRRARSGASETRLATPIGGVVAVRHLDVGAQVAPNQPIVSIVDATDLEVDLQLPERELGKLALKQPVRIESEALQEHQFPAEVSAIAPTVDPISGTIKVTAELLEIEDAAGRRLRPGMFVEARVVTDTRDGVPLVPKRALLYEETRPYVFVVEDGKARWAWIETGVSDGGVVEVKSGLKPGSEVVVLGQATLKEDTAVNVTRRNGEPVEKDEGPDKEQALAE